MTLLHKIVVGCKVTYLSVSICHEPHTQSLHFPCIRHYIFGLHINITISIISGILFIMSPVGYSLIAYPQFIHGNKHLSVASHLQLYHVATFETVRRTAASVPGQINWIETTKAKHGDGIQSNQTQG